MTLLVDPEKNWNNDQVLGEPTTSFVVQSLCNGKVLGLSEVPGIVVYKVELS